MNLLQHRNKYYQNLELRVLNLSATNNNESVYHKPNKLGCRKNLILNNNILNNNICSLYITHVMFHCQNYLKSIFLIYCVQIFLKFNPSNNIFLFRNTNIFCFIISQVIGLHCIFWLKICKIKHFPQISSTIQFRQVLIRFHYRCYSYNEEYITDS